MAFHINVDGHGYFMWFSNRVTSAQAETGKVILLFQPAEDGSGAQKVFSDTKFAAFNQTMFCLT
jgi:metal-dependent amidase/aminoacylase/carboxypeptidase family protein